MFSGNLLKGGFANLQDAETRVIDTNELVARRIEALGLKMYRPENQELISEEMEGRDGFSAGLSAETVEGLLSEEDGDDDTPRSNVIKAMGEPVSLAKAKEEAEEILASARARAEAEEAEMRSSAQEALAREREETLAAAREQGYREGAERAAAELEEERRKFQESLARQEQEYQDILDGIEPQLIEAITGIYEHIFHVELGQYREVLVYLIASSMRKIEGARDFLVHVSKEDYAYVSMQKKEILAGASSANCNVEIVEDITLARNECMIETEGGIFDCGLGTQMAELRRKLRLLSYEK